MKLEAGGRRQATGGGTQAAGGSKQELCRPLSTFHFPLLLTTIIFLFTLNTTAQQAEAWLDTNKIIIGAPTHLTLDLKFTSATKVDSLFWPSFTDSIATHVELLSESNIDTIYKNPANPEEFSLRQILTITSWDSGYWAILPISFLVRTDTVRTQALLLQVDVPQVNLADDIHDISDIYDIGLSWWDLLKKYWPWLLCGVIVIAAILYFLLKPRPQKIAQEVVIKQPEIPAHVAAMIALEKLRADSLWQQGYVKEYYSQLSDIIREYLEHHFKIHAKEETSSQIIRSMRPHALTPELVSMLQNILFLADMAKFAKQKPLPHENETAIAQAREFVERTKPVETKA